MQDAAENHQAIRQQAAEWVIRLGAGRLEPDERQALDEWCARSSEHEKALAFARTTWQELGSIDTLEPSDDPQHVSDPIAAEAEKSRKSGTVYGVLAAAMVLVAVLSSYVLPDQIVDWRADYTTAVGEIRSVSLPDGSSALLNTHSAISIDFEGTKRTVTVSRGEVIFEVVPSDKEAFTVIADNGTIQALGTKFLVQRQSDHVAVTAMEHRISVAGAVGDPLQMAPGDSVLYSSAGVLGEVYGVEPALVAPWQKGQLVFKKMALAEVVAELNRYLPERVMILDPDLSAREVSGVFLITKLDGAVDFIARQLGADKAQIPSVAIALY